MPQPRSARPAWNTPNVPDIADDGHRLGNDLAELGKGHGLALLVEAKAEAVHKVDVGNVLLAQLLRSVQELLAKVRRAHAAVHAVGRQPGAHVLGAKHLQAQTGQGGGQGGGQAVKGPFTPWPSAPSKRRPSHATLDATHRDELVDDLAVEAVPVLNAAAVLVRALVAARLEKFVTEVAVGAVELDAVKARLFGVLGRLAVLLEVEKESGRVSAALPARWPVKGRGPGHAAPLPDSRRVPR